jgi:hypothetical protein
MATQATLSWPHWRDGFLDSGTGTEAPCRVFDTVHLLTRGFLGYTSAVINGLVNAAEIKRRETIPRGRVGLTKRGALHPCAVIKNINPMHAPTGITSEANHIRSYSNQHKTLLLPTS